MTHPPPPFLDALEQAAQAAQTVELDLRARAAAEIAACERARAFAFRRLDLARTLATALVGATDEDSALRLGSAALARDLGWHGESPARRRILDAARPLLLAIWEAGRPDCAADAPARVTAAFAAFEDGYAQETGTDFLALFDQEYPELPLVEF